jgi:hypothetical protein
MTTAAPIAPATTDATTDGFLHPPSGLLITVTDPTTNQPGAAFPLQTTAWLKMQTVVNTALGFPLSSADFTTLYGTFQDEAAVEGAVTVLGNIKTTATQYGDPATLISQLSSFQSATTPPDSIYGNAVWLAAQTQANAQQIVSLLQEGLTDIGQETDPQQRIADLQALLTGEGSVTSYATTLQGQVTAFQDKTTTFYGTLNSQLTGPTDSLKSYLGQSSNVLADAQSAVTTDQGQIDALNTSIHHLNEEYIGFTIAASLSPLLTLIPFVGIPLAIADATTFGILATKVKNQIAALQGQLATVSADEQQKTALVTQLTGFNLSTQSVETDGQAFLDALATLAAGWGAFQTQVALRLSSLTPKDVTDWNAFLDKVNFQAAVDGWNLVGAKAETFFQTGFVTFQAASSN